MLKQLAALAVAIGVGACSAQAPATDTASEEGAAAAPQAAAGASAAVALPECASLPAPAPDTRYIATDCRVDPKTDGTQFLVRFGPTPEEVMAGGRIDVEVVGADGAVRDTLVEAYVFQYRYPTLSDTDGDGVQELLIPRQVEDGQVTRSVWKLDPADGRYRQSSAITAPQ